jgi:hypothetical protein
MVVVLRMDRAFMVYVEEAHPEVVEAFSLDAQRAAAAQQQQQQQQFSSTSSSGLGHWN